MSELDLDALGARYREAKAAIAAHRCIQARAERACIAARRRWPDDHPKVVAARYALDRAVADVDWCRAAVVAVAEAIKGEPFDVVLARNQANRHRLSNIGSIPQHR